MHVISLLNVLNENTDFLPPLRTFQYFKLFNFTEIFGKKKKANNIAKLQA